MPPSGVRRCSGAHSVRFPACVGRPPVVAIRARTRHCTTQIRLPHTWRGPSCRVPGVGFASGPNTPRHRITASGFRRFDDVATQGESGESAPLMPGI